MLVVKVKRAILDALQVDNPENFTWEAGRYQRGHHDTVGPLGGVK